MKILVTGGAGYIGSVLVPELLARGHRVTVLDNFMYGVPSLAACCADPNLTIVRGDVRTDMNVLSGLFHLADVIVPLAAIVGAPACGRDIEAAVSVNQVAIAKMVSQLSSGQLIVYSNTNSGYGSGGSAPCTEETPLRPLSLYGQTKARAEESVMAHGNAVCFRLATVFGASPRMRTDLLVNDFVLRAVTDRAMVLFEAHFVRNYVHVRDAASAILAGVEDRLPHGVYNVGLPDANLTKAQLCAAIARHVPGFTYLEAPVGEDPDKRDYVVSNDKILATGAWAPRHTIDDGIVELIKAYQMLPRAAWGNV